MPLSLSCLYVALCLTPNGAEPKNPFLLPSAAPGETLLAADFTDSADQPFVIEEEPSPGQSRRDRDLFEYFNIDALGGGSAGQGLTRNFSYLRFGGQYSTDRFVLFGNYLQSRVVSHLDMELREAAVAIRNSCRMDPSFRPIEDDCAYWQSLASERVFEFRYRDEGLDEIYGQATLLDNLSLLIGKNRITWGQFAIVSPVHLLLPLNTEQQIGFSKVEARVPQPVVQFNYYPTEHLHLQLSYITETELSPEFEEFFNVLYRGELTENGDSYETRYAPGYNASLEAGDQFASHSHTAFRALYEPDWGVVGLTLWEGPLHFDVPANDIFFCDDFTRHYCEPGPDPAPGEEPTQNGTYFSTIAPDLIQTSAFGLEAAVHLKNWTLIGEYVSIAESVNNTDLNPALSTAIAICGQPGQRDRQCEQYRSEARQLLAAIARNNGGSGVFTEGIQVLALGADGTSPGGNWVYNLEILSLFFDASPALTELYSLPINFDEDLSDALTPGDSSFVIPSVHVSNSHSFGHRPATWGVALGFFLQFGGLFSYYNVDVNDNVSVQFALELIDRVAETDAAATDFENYSLKNQSSAALSLATQIKF